jgi:hypothetical protein|tara:strand:- start:5992 stop:6699 length:708 start_codon:yes stop_codon:yes gene_type:complete
MENIMTLPTITLPKYKLKLHSAGNAVSFRPFVVKEEKVLMIAMESGNFNMIVTAIKDTVKSCTFDKINVDELPVFDLCHLFLNIRAKSVGETAEPILYCQHCDAPNPVEIDLTKINIDEDKEHTKKISLGGELGIVMKYPVLSEDVESEEQEQISIKSIADCIDIIYEGDAIHKSSEYKDEELKTFIEGLTHKQFESILNFFSTMPKLHHDVKFKCAKCEKENEFALEGLGDFFL